MGLPHHIVRRKKYHLWRHIAEPGTHSALAKLFKYENMVNRPADGFVVASIGAYALYVHVFMAIWKEHLN